MWSKRLVLVVGLVALVGTGCARAESDEVVRFEATLAGRSVADSSPTDPIELDHEQITDLSVTMTNRSSEPVTVAHVRLEGHLLDLIFLTYDTGIHEPLDPGETRTVAFALDFFDLRGQAHGLLRSEIRLYDPDRHLLGSQPLVVDGRGSPFATMAVFNLVLAAVAAASIGWNLLRLGQRRLPGHRFARGLRFVHSGAAVGLTLAAASSVLRIWPLPTTTWILVTVIAALVGFVLGYLSPGADEADPVDVVIDLGADVLQTSPPMPPTPTGSEWAGTGQ